MLSSRLLGLLLAPLLLLLPGWSSRSHAAPPVPEALTGWFHIIHSTPPPAAAAETYVLVTERGEWIELRIDASVAERLGELHRLDRQRVTVSLERGVPGAELRPGARGEAVRVQSVRAESLRTTVASPGRPVARDGSFPYLTILCRFADAVSLTPHPRSRYEAMLGEAFPGLDHYWREVSGGRIDTRGSQVVGWYDLPHPLSYYLPEGANGNPDWGRMVDDCTGVADADVDFTQYYGINLQFNTRLRSSWGGSWTLARDGQVRQYGVTWMSSAASLQTYIHEMGHSLGLPHSAGPYGEVYDSKWDPMSGGKYTEAGEDVGVHTIAYHKDLLGWIPAARKHLPAPGTRSEILLERGAQPPSSGFLLAEIPLAGNPEQFYTVEARRRVGYDRGIPDEGVVVHTVAPVSSVRSVAARVLDVDNNGDPNDAGARWRPGQTFTDPDNGVSISVLAATASGYRLSVRRGWQLTLEVAGSGVVSSTTEDLSCAATCEHLYAVQGTAVALTATPAAGWRFGGWTGACVGTGACSLQMARDRAVQAVFTPLEGAGTGDLLRLAVMGAAYADTLRTTLAARPVTWRISAGALPEGLLLDEQTGSISGVPARAGVFNFTATASAGSRSARTSYRISVSKPQLDPQAVLQQLVGGQALSPDEVRFLDLLGNRDGRLDTGDVRIWLLENQHLDPARSPALQHLRRPPPSEPKAQLPQPAGSHRHPAQEPEA